MESVSRTEAMKAYWQAIEIVTKADQVIKEYQNWLENEESEFRKRVTPGLRLDGDLLEPGKLYTLQCKWLNNDEIESEDVQGLIGERIPVNDFYIEFFGEQYNQNLGNSLWLKDDDKQTIRMFRRYAVMRGKHNKSIQTLLTYTMEATDSALAAKILPLVDYDNVERPESFVFNTFATDETIELANAFEMWCNIYNPELLVRDGDGNNAPDQTPTAVKMGGKTNRLNANFPAYTIDTERLKKLFEYLRDNQYISEETRIEDWMQANGHEQQGEEIKKIKWKRSIEQLAWMIALMYPQDNKEEYPMVQKGVWNWVVKCWCQDKKGVVKELKEQRLREAKNRYNKAKETYGVFFNKVREILRGTQKQDE